MEPPINLGQFKPDHPGASLPDHHATGCCTNVGPQRTRGQDHGRAGNMEALLKLLDPRPDTGLDVLQKDGLDALLVLRNPLARLIC